MLSDFPEMKELFDKLMAEKVALVAKAKPFRDKYKELHDKIAPLEAEQREVIKGFRAIEQPRMAEIDQQLSAIAKATGGRVMVNEGAK